MATIQLRTKSYISKRSKELLDVIYSPSVRIEVNKIIKDAIEPYVPYDSGDLRRSVVVGPNSITWGEGLDYAHYQHEGEIYGPNIPIIHGGSIVGWFTRAGEGEKYPTGRELGIRHTWKNWPFGYTTFRTQHHWTDVYKYSLFGVRKPTNTKITNYLKQVAKSTNK